LVALKSIWHNEIDILYIAIFTLKKDVLLSNSNIAEQILSGTYLGNYIPSVASNGEVLQKNISALVYGVAPNDAEQIPIQKYIEGCLNNESGYDINKYSNHKHFISILNEKVSNRELSKENLIVALSKLNSDFTEKIMDIWINVITKENVKSYIEEGKINESDFKQILDVYKILTKEKSLLLNFNEQNRQTIWNALASKTDTPEYLEIVAIQLGHIDQIPQRLSPNNTQNQTFTQISKITLNTEQIKIVSENLDYYASYGDLLLESISKNVPALNSVLKYMTENKLGYTLSLEEVLPKFFEIKNKIDVSESTLFEQFNDWKEHKNSITKDNIQTIISDANLFQYSVETKNELTDYLNKTIIEKLSEVSTDILYQQKRNAEDYWMSIIKRFINTDYLKILPDNLTEFGKRLLDDIAIKEQNIPDPQKAFQTIINKLDKRKTATLIKDIRDKFCNSQYIMDTQLFMYFDLWFEQQGDLLSRSADVVHKILEPVINDINCLNIIISKSDYYAQIIIKAGDDAMELKEIIKKKITNSDDASLISFAKKIGVEQEKQE